MCAKVTLDYGPLLLLLVLAVVISEIKMTVFTMFALLSSSEDSDPDLSGFILFEHHALSVCAKCPPYLTIPWIGLDGGPGSLAFFLNEVSLNARCIGDVEIYLQRDHLSPEHVFWFPRETPKRHAFPKLTTTICREEALPGLKSPFASESAISVVELSNQDLDLESVTHHDAPAAPSERAVSPFFSSSITSEDRADP